MKSYCYATVLVKEVERLATEPGEHDGAFGNISDGESVDTLSVR
jgi:hypothetical protein